MISHRKISLIAGVLYLITFVSIPTLGLYSAIHSLNYITSSSPDTSVLIGAVLEIVMALASIGTAVALYPILKKQNEGMAIGLVASRVLEASTIFAGVAFLLTIVNLKQTGAGTEMLATGHMLVTMYDRIFLIGQSFMPAVNDLLLGIMLYRSRLVPRFLPLIGIIGAFILITGDVAVLFGYVGQHGSISALVAILVALFELLLGIWLIVKGFNTKAVVTLELKSKTLNY
jgi:hypothetical protein